VKIFQTDNSLAKSRQLGIQNVDVDYFVFIDDDIILPKGWFKKLWSNVDSKTGAIHAYALPAVHLPYEEKWRIWQEKWVKSKQRRSKLNGAPLRKEVKIIEIKKENKNKFLGYTHNTIIKLDACRDWITTIDLPVFEDQVLLWHIVKKGYKWKIVREITVQHYTYRNLFEHLRKVKWRIAGQRLVGLANRSIKQLLFIDFFKRFAIGCKSFTDIRDPFVLVYVLLLHFIFLDGYLRWDKHIYLSR
jgi:glycosyltransferase involved in cell wall biosynthesis